MTSLNTYASRDALMRALADKMIDELENTLAQKGQAVLVVPGGSSPGPVFDLLCDAPIDWGRVSVLLSDERWVPISNARSNTKLIKERLLVSKAQQAKYVPLYAPDCTPQQGAKILASTIAPLLPISVALLGMGEDMHTASLFPAAAELPLAQSNAAPAVLALAPQDQGLEPRVTLSAQALKTAQNLHILIMGKAKYAAFEQAKTLPKEQAPIAQFLPLAQVHWAA